ncbi:hypothetical protein O9X98_15735 [Agrobacterium salinitolerans]|nr:hypothetical protein [Agrobacterium salinitolerans]
MQLDISFPVMARITKRNAEGEFRMLVSHVHRADVPEVSKSETEIALPPVKLSGDQPMVLPELRSHEGRIYRYLDTRSGKNPTSHKFADLFGHAFSEAGPGRYDFVYRENEPVDHILDRMPLSRPIHELYQERLCALSMDGLDSRNKTWPKSGPFVGFDKNEKQDFKAAMERVASVSADDLDEAFAMHRAQADKLLIIDDSIWYETRPPCIEVDTFWNQYKPTESILQMRYRYMPETLEQAPSSIFFPLSQAALARETAENLRERYKMRGVEAISHEFEVSDHPAFDVATSEDLVHRTAQALLTNLLKHIIQRPDRATAIDAGWIASLTDTYHADNHVLGKRADYSTDLSMIVDHFLSMYWNKFTGGLSLMTLPQMRKVLPVVVEMMDDMPISIPGLASVHTLGK